MSRRKADAPKGPVGPEEAASAIEKSAVELDIHRVCDELNSEGLKPSYKLIRERRGSGSWSTINKYLGTWIPQEVDPSLELPDDLGRLLTSVGKEFWSTAMRIALKEKIDAGEAWAEREAELLLAIQHGEGDLDRAQSRAEGAESQVASLRAQLVHQQVENNRLSLLVSEMTGELKALRAQIETSLSGSQDPSSRIARLYPKEQSA